MNQEDIKILGDLSFYVGRRDLGSESVEELIDLAFNKQIDISRLNYLDWKTRDLVNSIRTREESEFTFFWETESPLSQWYKVSFTSSNLFIHRGINDAQREYLSTIFPKDLEFSSAEQFMMYHKAVLFLDKETAYKILNTNNPRKIKELGRKVKNYEEYVWEYFRSNVVYVGNRLKFEQNPSLMMELINTSGTTIVEAAPNDLVWGIGLTGEDPRSAQRNTWLGKNLLGEILTILRMEFTNTY